MTTAPLARPATILDRPLVCFAVLFVLILAMMPPNGVLSDNEENYFGLAARSVGAILASPDSALFDASHHRVVNEFLLGHLIAWVGFAPAQTIARTLAAAGYAGALTLWVRGLALNVIDAAAVVLLFALVGQTLMGGEWLFRGYEGKVAAYGFAILGLYGIVLRRNFVWSIAAFAVATYFHFLVGGFWLAAGLLYAALAREAPRKILLAAAGYLVCIAPLLFLVMRDRLGDAVPTDYRGPAPDAIYALIRSPHHVAPYMSWVDFRKYWLPGFALTAPMLAATVAVIRRIAAPRRPLAVWLAILLAYLLVAAALSFFDRDTGWLGKFYLFRPAALLLLLWLSFAATALRALPVRAAWAMRLAFLAVTLPQFVVSSVAGIPGDIAWRDRQLAEQVPLFAAIDAVTKPGDIVLIGPNIEYAYYDFERRTGRASLVVWKFDNTNDRDIVEWYRRMRFRATLFENGCQWPMPYRVDFLLAAPERAEALARSCGLIVYRGLNATLIAVHERAPLPPELQQKD